MRCDETRHVLPELALGIADGEERAPALDHLAGCPACRRRLDELSSVADELVALAPRSEPPAGFEGRVLGRIGIGPAPVTRPHQRRLGRLRLAAAALAAAGATAVAMNVVYSSDRGLAAQYRAALQSAHGTYFQSAALRTPDGRRAGTVFGYQGSPSWLFYVLDGRSGDDVYQERIVTRAGRTIGLPRFRLVAGGWGSATPIPIRDVALVRLVGEPHGPMLEARLPLVER